MTYQASASHKSTSPLPTILKAWLIAGTLDGLSAITNYTINGGKHPEKIFSYIASGIFGKEASAGGNTMILLGVLFHYLIAFAFTILFYFLYPKIKALLKNKFIMAIVYGLFVWAVMNLIVVPKSNTPKFPFKTDTVIINMVILILAIGLPLSLIIGNYYSKIKKVPDHLNH